MIANTTLGGSAATIDLTGIPGHYAHLRLVCYLRGDTATPPSYRVDMRFNGDRGANYDIQYLLGQGAGPGAGEFFADTKAQVTIEPGGTATANLFSVTTIDIPHYANSVNNKCTMSRYSWKIAVTTSTMAAGR